MTHPYTDTFITARCYTERGYEIACRLSVRLPVCLSVTLRYIFHSLEYFENIFTAE